MRHEVILLPGAVLPVDLAYGALLEALGDKVSPVAKELELHAGEEPLPSYTLDLEVEGVLRASQCSTTSTRRIGLSPSGWPRRFAIYGLAPNRPRPQRARCAP